MVHSVRSWYWCTTRILKNGFCLTSWKTCLTRQKFKLNARTIKGLLVAAHLLCGAQPLYCLSVEQISWFFRLFSVPPAARARIHITAASTENTRRMLNPRSNLRFLRFSLASLGAAPTTAATKSSVFRANVSLTAATESSVFRANVSLKGGAKGAGPGVCYSTHGRAGCLSIGLCLCGDTGSSPFAARGKVRARRPPSICRWLVG